MATLAAICLAELERKYEPGTAAELEARARLVTELTPGGSTPAGGLLPRLPRHYELGARGGCGAAWWLAEGERESTPRTGTGLSRLLDHLLPDRALQHRSGEGGPLPRALPQRGAPEHPRHRPRFFPGHPRTADPTRIRKVRRRPRGAGVHLSLLPAALGRARDRQGAGPPPGGVQRVRLPQVARGGVRAARLPVCLAAALPPDRVLRRAFQQPADGILLAGRDRAGRPPPRRGRAAPRRERERGRMHLRGKRVAGGGWGSCASGARRRPGGWSRSGSGAAPTARWWTFCAAPPRRSSGRRSKI